MFRVRHNLDKKFKFVEGRTPKRSEAKRSEVVRRSEGRTPTNFLVYRENRR